MPDRNYTEGPGIRVGDLELHPGVVVRGGYSSNVYLADGDFQRRQGAAILAVTPHLHLQTLGAQRRSQGEDRPDANSQMPKLQFRSGLSATYYQYFNHDGPKNLGVDSDFWVGILPRRPVNFEVSASYLRNVTPFTQQAANTNGKSYIYDIVSPTLRMNVGTRSQVLTGYVGYAPRISIYESATFNYLNNFAHDIQAGASWRFLPNTALVYDADFILQDYQKDLNTSSSPVVLSDNKRFRTRAGINGALTRTLVLKLLAGYSAGFFDNPQLNDFEKPVGEASLTQRFGPGGVNTAAIGYLRDVQASALGGWILMDRGYFSLGTVLGRIFALSMEGGVAHLGYGRLLATSTATGSVVNGNTGLGANGQTKRNDVRLDGGVHGELRVTNWLAFTADFSVQALLTDFKYANFLNGQPLPDPARYFVVSAFGGVRAHY